jgi:hypothetical protein
MRWLPHKLQLQVSCFAVDATLACAVGRVEFFLEHGEAVPASFKPELLTGSHVGYMPGTSMIRRDVFDTLGSFAEDWEIASDIAWFANLRDSGLRIQVIDDIVLRKRIHGSNLSSIAATTPVLRRELLRVARAAFLRQQRRPSASRADDP